MQDEQLHRDKEALMNEFRQMQTQMHDLKRVHENFVREIKEKEVLIERLKEAKMALDHELEHLTRENESLRDTNDKLTHENSDLRSELNQARNQVSKIEVQYDNCMKQRNYMKEQMEVITQNSAKGNYISWKLTVFIHAIFWSIESQHPAFWK